MTPAKDIDLLSLLGDRAPSLRILDVGALFVAEVPIAYAALLRDKRNTAIGFEPIKPECDRLNRMFGPVHKFFPYVIGNGSTGNFYRCTHSMTSSLLKPNADFIQHFQNLPEFCEIAEVIEVKTVRLDDVPEALGADYIKLDVQGSEKQVLAGAEACLNSVLVVHIEIEFVQIYEGQPVFGDIDATLRSHGFMFHRLLNIEGRTLAHSSILDTETTRNQQLFADAVYIRPITKWSTLSSEQLIKLALILHQLYGSVDFCSRLLAIYDGRKGTEFLEKYLSLLLV